MATGLIIVLLAFFLSPLVALIALVAVPRGRAAGKAPREAGPVEDPAVAAARLVNAVRQDNRWTEGTRWDVATSAATSTRRLW
jgi:hypothetical protein